MSDKYFFSIVMPVYNGALTLEKSVDAVFNQTFQDFEFIIINDCSTDATAAMLEELRLKNDRVKIITNESQQGVAGSLNKGIEIAQGTYIARLDCDDYWREDKLQKQHNFLINNPEYGVVGTNFISKSTSTGEEEKIYLAESHDQIAKRMIKENVICHPSVVIWKELFSQYGYYQPYRCEDYELWLRFLPYTKFYNIQNFLIYKAKSETNLSYSKWKEFFYAALRIRLKYFSRYKFSPLFYLSILENLVMLMIPKNGKKYYRFIHRKIHKEKNNKQKNVLFFLLSRGVDLGTMDKQGTLPHEIQTVNFFAEKFEKVYVACYGQTKQENYKKFIKVNVEFLYKPKFINDFIYEWLAPFIHWKYFKQKGICRSEQTSGSYCGVVAKLFFKKKLVVRNGYIIGAQCKYDKKVKLSIKLFYLLNERISYEFADLIIISFREGLDYAVNKYKVDKKAYLVPNWVEVDKFKPSGNPPMHKDTIIYLGRLSMEKNLPMLIEAISQTKYKLDIYGQGNSKDELENLAKKSGAQVNFKGRESNDQLPAAFQHYMVYALISNYECMPKSLIEAMACGLACIGTDVMGIHEIIKNKENGLLVEVNSPESLKQAILYIMENEEEAKRLGANARKFVVDNFEYRKVMEKEYALYTKLLNK